VVVGRCSLPTDAAARSALCDIYDALRQHLAHDAEVSCFAQPIRPKKITVGCGGLLSNGCEVEWLDAVEPLAPYKVVFAYDESQIYFKNQFIVYVVHMFQLLFIM